MKKFTLIFAITLVSMNAWSSAIVLRCNSQKGEVLINFEPLSASWVNKDGSTTPFLRYGNICNQDVSNYNPKPNCRAEERSEDHYWIQTLECEHGGQWFADAVMEISQITKDGRFQCKSKFGSKADIKLELDSCRPF
ncbi:hypothetical protein DOM22_18630 [Bdellovibrio sp. ZAP7]|uniref:hypothetical protein n=1 Tax=Bdellovibrio sp. ZAP7 TaxID=2231053 RepID=UPI0011592869|nr:hypothetical protein [Bdellovibrio sp. ZAP7]QDK47030.1 hypothetical protein DOM22_18630 [Bdellovibrio sp. ZAP7]